MDSRPLTPPLRPWWRGIGTQLSRTLPLGIVQIVFGVVITVVGTVQYFTFLPLSAPVSPIWGGLLIHIPAGIMAIVSVTAPVYVRPCMNIVSMVSNILAGCVAFGNAGWTAVMIAQVGDYAPDLNGMQSTVLVFSILVLVVDILTVVFTACNLVDLKSPMQYSPIPFASAEGYSTTTSQPGVVGYAPVTGTA